jgi:shikimate dehydrogenase
VRSAALCYDMAYAKSETPFARWAREQGCPRAVQGWGMLVEQAAEAFELWRGIRPDTRPVLALLTQPAAASVV